MPENKLSSVTTQTAMGNFHFSGHLCVSPELSGFVQIHRHFFCVKRISEISSILYLFFEIEKHLSKSYKYLSYKGPFQMLMFSMNLSVITLYIRPSTDCFYAANRYIRH